LPVIRGGKARERNLTSVGTKGNKEAEKLQNAFKEDAEQLRQCRSRTWPETQAIWRACTHVTFPGALDNIMDRLVNRGYNQVYIEVLRRSSAFACLANLFGLPLSGAWGENTDLLAQAIQRGRERGLKVYAWMF